MVRAFTVFMVFLPASRFYRLASTLSLAGVVATLSLAPGSKAAVVVPTITLAASPVQIDEGGAAVYTLTASTINPDQATTITFSMRGKAALGKHYVLEGSSSQVTIPAGAASANIALTSLITGLNKGSETAKMILQAGSGYSLSSAYKASVTIVNVPASPTPTPSATPSPTPTPESSATPIPTPAQEIWIAVRGDRLPGTGTQADPFDGSTPAKFDAVMLSYYWTHNLGVHLTGPGPFRTYANHAWKIGPGWVLSGDGMYSTTIQMVGNVAGMRQVACIRSDPNISTDNVVIRDLTCDANWAQLSATADNGAGGEKNIKTSAVSIGGSNILVERVRSINTYGSWANLLEHFDILLGGSPSGDGTNNIIQFCRAELPQGNYGNPFALGGWLDSTASHLITNSKVVSCTAVGVNNGLGAGFTSGGVNLANVKDCEIDGNTFIDCSGAAYIDTGSVDGLRVINNTVIRGSFGVGICNRVFPRQNIEISGNNFSIQNRVPGGASCAIVVDNGTTTNFTMKNNTISFDTSGRGSLQFWGVITYLLNTATISDNTIGEAPSGVYNNASGSGLTMFNNRTPEGTLIPTLNNQ